MRAASPAPRLSIVVAAWSGEGLLLPCLASIEPQTREAEVLVAANSPVAEAQRRYPSFRFLRGADGADVFRLRALGAGAAEGRVVALIEDHVTVSPGWADALLAAHSQGHGIVGGPVENGLTEGALDWALYFCEYGLHMPPVAEGPVGVVSGLNVSWDRSLLAGCRDVWAEALHENEVNDRLRSAGHTPHMAPRAEVASHLPMTLGGAMSHLFGGGNQYARYRCTQTSRLGRMKWILVSPAVPFVLLVRIARRVAARDRSRLRHLARGAFHFALVLGAWSVGEAWGYLQGPSRSGRR